MKNGELEFIKCDKPDCAYCKFLLHEALGLIKEQNNLSSFIIYVNKLHQKNGN